jgi:hypothetical protein
VTTTLETISLIRDELGVNMCLGASNVSFGLNAVSRVVLNSVFLHECIQAGLDSAIVHAAKIIPIARIPEEQREVALDMVYDRRRPATATEPAHAARPVRADAGVAGADHHVGFADDQRREDHAKLARIVLAVAVDLHCDVEAVREREAEAGLHCAADSQVEGENQQPGSGRLGDRSGPVVGAVVHDDDLEARIRGADLLDHSPDRGRLVERRDDRDQPFQRRLVGLSHGPSIVWR